MNETKKVYAAIAAVTKALSKEGIGKDRKNELQGYKFRGIDDVYNALAPFLADANLCILPNVQSRECIERTSAKGNALFYVTVKVDFAFVSAEDASEHHVVTYGEAMDSGDKATNKAMSAAFKYAAMQAFCIPTQGDNDADSQTHEVQTRAPSGSPAQMKEEAFEGMPKPQQDAIRKIAADVTALCDEERSDDAWLLIEKQRLEMVEKLGLWYLLSAKHRTAIKEADKRLRVKAA